MIEGRVLAPGLAGLLAAAVLMLLQSSFLPAQIGGQELEGKPVVRIKLVGLKDLDPAAVKSLMETREGQPFREEALDRDLHTLIDKDVFVFIPWVKAELTPDGKGVIVTLEASSTTSRAVRVVFLGAVEYKREDLKPLIRTAAGRPVNDFTLVLDREAILNFYKKNGYHFAEVDFIKKREAIGDLVIFKITEGPKVKIRRVHLEGALSFSKDELLAKMPFVDEPGLFSSKDFVLEQVKRDVVQLGRWYRGQGFLDAQVILQDWIPTPDHEKVDLFIHIEEGPPFIVRSVTIEGVTLFDPEELKALMRTKPGRRYAPGSPDGDLFRDRRDIRNAYRERGYTEAQVLDASQIDLEKPEVDVILRVKEGELVRVGEIRIQGNLETQDRIIRREIELYTGDPLNYKKLEQAERRIRALRYWDETEGVSVNTPPMPFQAHQIYKDAYLELSDTNRKNVKDIVVTVRERDTGSLRFAAGVGSNTGFVGDITYR